MSTVLDPDAWKHFRSIREELRELLLDVAALKETARFDSEGGFNTARMAAETRARQLVGLYTDALTNLPPVPARK